MLQHIAPHSPIEAKIQPHSWTNAVAIDADKKVVLLAVADGGENKQTFALPSKKCRPIPPPTPPDFFSKLRRMDPVDAWYNKTWCPVVILDININKQTNSTKIQVKAQYNEFSTTWVDSPLVRPRWQFRGNRWEAAAPVGLFVYEDWLLPVSPNFQASSSITNRQVPAARKRSSNTISLDVEARPSKGIRASAPETLVSSATSYVAGARDSHHADDATVYAEESVEGDVHSECRAVIAESQLADALAANQVLASMLISYRDRIEEVSAAARSLWPLAHAGAIAAGATLALPDVVDRPLPRIPEEIMKFS